MTSALFVELKPEVEEGLERLSQSTQRKPAALAAEAITAYVMHQTAIVEGINRGLADLEAGRLVSHGEAMAEIAALIDAQRDRI